MATVNRQVQSALRRLYRIVEAGEKGYATAATNANGQALKLLFKSFAQQRARYKIEIQDEIVRLGGDHNPRSSILGIIHRGRVAIFAAMTIEDDRRRRVILKEAAIGERFAVQTYQKTLAHELPPETRQIVERQYEEVQKVIDQIQLMLGKDGKILVVRLFSTEQQAEQAAHALQQAGFPPQAIEKVGIDSSIDLYHGRGTTVLETIISGIVGGMVWGTLIGVLAGIGAAQTALSDVIGANSFLETLVMVALITIAAAAFVGGLIGLVIGAGISDDDTYAYQQSVLPGRCLLKALVDIGQENEVGQILDEFQNPTRAPVAGVSA